MVDIWMIFGMVVPFCEIISFVSGAIFTREDENGTDIDFMYRVPGAEEKIIRPESDHSKALSLTYSCCGDLIDVTLADA